MSTPGITTKEIEELFRDQIKRQGGTVSDLFDDGQHLFGRSVLSQHGEVKPGDQLNGGVAVKANSELCQIIPYVFRQVCCNGVIMASSLQAHHVVLRDELATEVLPRISDAIAACCQESAVSSSINIIRASMSTDIDMLLSLLPVLALLSNEHQSEILSRFFELEDVSPFGLMNAVTSLARDTADPAQRWRLEELGGGIAARRLPEPPANRGGRYFQFVESMAIG